ncbi:DinB family protein [Mucilaginibacter koreensis]
MTIHTQTLLQQLKVTVEKTLTEAKQLQLLPLEVLAHKADNSSWSILQVIEHLNTYNSYYLPLITNAFLKHPDAGTTSTHFTSSWLGNYFVKLMQPDANGQVTKKMKAAPQHQPGQEPDTKTIINNFISGQQQLLIILETSHQYPLERIKIPISIFKLIKLNLGDVMRFLVTHQQRHFVQINDIINSFKQNKPADHLN